MIMNTARTADDTKKNLQNASVRRGGEAAGGIAPQAGDPTNPDLADARAEERDQAQAEHGFGEDGARSTLLPD
jgi:hypothetical protein